MAFQVSGPAVPFLPPLLALLLFGLSPVLVQDLRETDALCNADGCFVVYFQRKIFLDSWRTCKERGGNLATIKRREDAAAIATLFSTLDLRQSRTNIRVWIGLQRQPRHCTATWPLRGFSWTTGDQDTEYTNWLREYSSDTCSVPRCVVMGYSTTNPDHNLKWLDGSCSVPVDGFLCHYAYKGMCPPLWSEGGVNVFYNTPFNLVSSLLTQVPIGSSATITCPEEERSALCLLKEGGLVGWSLDPPLCSGLVSPSTCELDNGGCEHYCRAAGDLVYCECADDYELREDGRSCEPSSICSTAPCKFECLQVSDGYRCACPDGYMLTPDEHGCVDVNECLQSPCEQLCVNTPGTFQCQCRDGYSPNDEGVCEDIDECADYPCDHDCENTLGSYICHCNPGFFLIPDDPGRCQDVDECQIPGTCEQMCWNYDGGFACYCKEGYKLMTDQLSCQMTREGENQPPATPPLLWPTPQPGTAWDPTDYDYTDWPTEQDLFTDPNRVLGPDLIWATRTPQEELPFGSKLTFNWWEGEQRPQLETTHTGVLPTTSSSSSTTPDQYKDGEEEETTAVPFLSTSTTSEGAWNWWSGITNPDQSLDKVVSTDPGHQNGPEEKSQDQSTAIPTQFTVSQAPLGGGRGDDREQGDNSMWLLVGLLVPICILIVVMVALGIVYCTHCGVQPRNKNTADCYHWISGAHDKQGATNPPAGAKTCV